MNLCKDCVHFNSWSSDLGCGPLGALRTISSEPTCKLTDRVDGSGRHGRMCRTERIGDEPRVCGWNGQHFKARKA